VTGDAGGGTTGAGGGAGAAPGGGGGATGAGGGESPAEGGAERLVGALLVPAGFSPRASASAARAALGPLRGDP
jgi:hypothetical protein